MAMPMYAIGVIPLLSLIKGKTDDNERADVKHVAYADDLAAAGKCHELLVWWKNVIKFGPLIGYNANPQK